MKKIISLFLFVLILTIAYFPAKAEQPVTNPWIISNGYTTFYKKADGTYIGWGLNSSGEVAVGNNENQLIPVSVPELSDIKEIVCVNGTYSFYALKMDGTVIAWGDNQFGQLGVGSYTDQLIPVQIPGLTEISKVVTDGYTAYAITMGGDVYAWGRNNYGQVGNNRYSTSEKNPVLLPELSNIRDIVCNGGVAYAIDSDGKVFAWGHANSGQIGNNSWISAQLRPVEVIGLTGVDQIVTNGDTTFALCQGGQMVYGWGANNYGQVGCSSSINKRIPVLLSGISDVKELIIEFKTTYAIRSDGKLFAWGHNSYGQLADGSTSTKSYPQLISGIPTVKQIISNGYSTCVLCTNNSVYAWGYNSYGGVGNGLIGGSQKAPYKINSLRNTLKIAGEEYTFFAVKDDGTVYSWGLNESGQAGVGTTGTQRTPTLVEISDVEDIQVFNNTVFAQDKQGTTYGWGANNYGQIGDDTTDNVLTPYVVSINEMTTAIGTGNVNSTVPIIGEIGALEISFTHPVNISYSIDPNVEDGFNCPDIQIRNNSKVPVDVRIESFYACSGGDLIFHDVMPDSVDWNNLNRQESKTYMALGLQYVDETEWLLPQPELIDPLYAAEVNNAFIGALAKESSAGLSFCCYHGMAFDGNYSAKHELIFVVSLL